MKIPHDIGIGIPIGIPTDPYKGAVVALKNEFISIFFYSAFIYGVALANAFSLLFALLHKVFTCSLNLSL